VTHSIAEKMKADTKMINWTIKRFEELSVTELYDILNLRSEVFVIEQDCIYQDMDYADQKALHLMGKAEEKLMAYARIFAPNIKYIEASIGRVVTQPAYRNIGLGKVLMDNAISYCLENFPKHHIRISAQCYLEKFYQNLGFEIVSAVYQEDGIDHQEMLYKS
jgi:ElaA protein